jgi:hypothetical protein
MIAINEALVCSFSGVMLIARPQFLFDSPKGDPYEVVIPERRALSVTYGGISFHIQMFCSNGLCSAGLLGVVGQTGTCK